MPLTPAEARRVYDRVGAKQDAQGWYEDAATDVLLAHGVRSGDRRGFTSCSHA